MNTELAFDTIGLSLSAPLVLELVISLSALILELVISHRFCADRVLLADRRASAAFPLS